MSAPLSFYRYFMDMLLSSFMDILTNAKSNNIAVVTDCLGHQCFGVGFRTIFARSCYTLKYQNVMSDILLLRFNCPRSFNLLNENDL